MVFPPPLTPGGVSVDAEVRTPHWGPATCKNVDKGRCTGSGGVHGGEWVCEWERWRIRQRAGSRRRFARRAGHVFDYRSIGRVVSEGAGSVFGNDGVEEAGDGERRARGGASSPKWVCDAPEDGNRQSHAVIYF